MKMSSAQRWCLLGTTLGVVAFARADVAPPPVRTIASKQNTARLTLTATDASPTTPEPPALQPDGGPVRINLLMKILGGSGNFELSVTSSADAGVPAWKRVVAGRVKRFEVSDDGRYVFGLCEHGYNEGYDHLVIIEAGAERLIPLKDMVDERSLAFDPKAQTVSIVTPAPVKTLTFKVPSGEVVPSAAPGPPKKR